MAQSPERVAFGPEGFRCYAPKIYVIMYGFCCGEGMEYGICQIMGYGTRLPAYQLGNSKILWGTREYGVPVVCDKRGSTVLLTKFLLSPIS